MDRENKAAQPLSNIGKNLVDFCMASEFQKMIVSLLAGLRIQQDELGKLKELFIELDRNADGSLSKEELKAGLENAQCLELFQAGGEDQTEAIVKRMDTNNDGRVDYSEFLQAAIDHQALLNKGSLEAAFKLIDENGDGQISLTELSNVFSGGQNSQSQDCRQLLREIMIEVDKDLNEMISLEEFNEAMRMQLRSAAGQQPSSPRK